MWCGAADAVRCCCCGRHRRRLARRGGVHERQVPRLARDRSQLPAPSSHPGAFGRSRSAPQVTALARFLGLSTRPTAPRAPDRCFSLLEGARAPGQGFRRRQAMADAAMELEQPQGEQDFDLEVCAAPLQADRRSVAAHAAVLSPPPPPPPAHSSPRPLPPPQPTGLCVQLLRPRAHQPPAVCGGQERGAAAGAGGTQAGCGCAEAGAVQTEPRLVAMCGCGEATVPWRCSGSFCDTPGICSGLLHRRRTQLDMRR